MRITLLESAKAAILSAEASGDIDSELAGEMWRTFQETTAEDGISMLSDAEQVRVLSGNSGMVTLIDPARRAVMLRQAQARQKGVAREAVNDALTVVACSRGFRHFT